MNYYLRHRTVFKNRSGFIVYITILLNINILSLAQKGQNPVIFADVPDMSIVRVGDTYYMSSTTMHMAPGCSNNEIKRSY